MMTVTAHIDVSTPQGRKIARELEKHKKYVQIDNPFPLGEDGKPVETFSLDESFEKWMNITVIISKKNENLSKHQGTS